MRVGCPFAVFADCLSFSPSLSPIGPTRPLLIRPTAFSLLSGRANHLEHTLLVGMTGQLMVFHLTLD